MGFAFWGMSKGKAAVERVMVNIGAPPVTPRLGDGVDQSELVALLTWHPQDFASVCLLYIYLRKLSHRRGGITRGSGREPSAVSVLWHRL